jgi:hypothetical protein
MIIVTSNLTEQDWEKVYGVYLLAETNVSIPWYIQKWGLNYNTAPDWLPTEEGVYGNPLSPNIHKMRVCIKGGGWAEAPSPELVAFLDSAGDGAPGINNFHSIGSDYLDQRMLAKIATGIKW